MSAIQKKISYLNFSKNISIKTNMKKINAFDFALITKTNILTTRSNNDALKKTLNRNLSQSTTHK